MNIKIINRHNHIKGEIYTIGIQKKTIEILFLLHAIERIEKWEIKKEMIVETLLLPEEVLVGHGNRYIAHMRYGDHLVWAVYEYENDLPILLTVYFPYRKRYFKRGGTYEDKIFKGS